MKKVKVSHVITPKLIRELYEKAATLPPEQAKEIIRQCEFFSSHIGEYLVQDIDNGDKSSMPEK